MVKLSRINNVFYANHVANLIFGKKKQINITASNAGSNYGLMKLILYGSSLSSLDTVKQNYIGLKTTGLNSLQKRILIFQNANILFMMELISIRRGVLLV